MDFVEKVGVFSNAQFLRRIEKTMPTADRDNPYRNTMSCTPDQELRESAPQLPQKPAAITVFAILNLAFGGIGICGGLATAVMFSMPQPAANPVWDLMDENPVYGTFNTISMVGGLVMSIVLVAAGIGLLSFARWGRTLSIAYAWYVIIATVVGAVFVVLFWIVPMLDGADAIGPESAVALAGAFGGLIGGLASLIYPIFILVFMYKDNVKESLD